MKEEVKRFGGELEFADVETRTSTHEARREFFDILHQRKPHVFDELLQLFNPASLPYEFRNAWQHIDFLTNFFLRNLDKPYLLRMKWSEANIEPDLAKTPIVFYYDYLSKKGTQLKEFAAQSEKRWRKYRSPNKDNRMKEDTLKGVIPNWKTIIKEIEAKSLCESLIDWSKKFNIYEDWVLDFALINLRKLKIIVDELQLSDENQYKFTQLDFDHFKRKAWSKSLVSHIWGEPNVENSLESYMEIDNYPPFEFSKFKYKIHDRWMPLYVSRSEFVERVEKEFLIQSKQKLEMIHESNNKLDSFIDELQLIKSTNDLFAKSLKNYCLIVLKIQPKGLVKVPVKKSGEKHFEWLIDFQINNPAERKYEDIASENNVNSKTVRDGIKSLSKIIGLKLRPAPHTGRPKGVKETKKRTIVSR